MADDDLAHFVRRQRLPLGLEADPLGLGLDEPGAEDSRRLARRGDHVGDRQIVGDQALREELDLDLADFPAELDHARHPRHAEQAGPHRPVGEGPKLHRRPFRGAQADHEDEARARGKRGHHRGADARGELAAHLHQALAHHLARAHHLGPFPEDRHDEREALNRLRADGVEVADAVHAVLHRARHERLDFLRRKPRRLGLEDHLRRGELGEDVDLRMARHVEAVEHHGAREGDDRPP